VRRSERSARPTPEQEEARVSGDKSGGGGNPRDKNLARQKLRQQQERERAAKAAARKRAQIIGAAVAVLLVVGGVFGAAQLIKNDDDTAAQDPSAQATDVVIDSTSPAPPGKANCVYAKHEENTDGKKVDLPPLIAEAKASYYATLKMSEGDVVLKLDSAAAPCAVNSFVHLAKAKFYDDTKCHRELIDGGYGVLQCGDPTGTGSGGPGYTFADENLNGAAYKKGILAMANAGPNTNGSQFFMVFRDSQFDPNYTPFGTIEKGLDVLEKIAKADTVVGATGAKDVPKKTVMIKKVTISTTP
jgi:peptidyl-prolyl cis-trans isomerase B (cyclophilin B)